MLRVKSGRVVRNKCKKYFLVKVAYFSYCLSISLIHLVCIGSGQTNIYSNIDNV